MSCQRDFSRRLRIGVVGVGSHAYRNVLPALHYLPVQPVAFCDANLELARRTAPEYGVARCHATLAGMIAGETLDAVFLAGTPATRGTLEFALHIMRIYEASLRSEGCRVAIPA